MLTSTLSTRFSAHVRRAALVAASAAAVTLLFSTGASMQAPRFYPDDPIAREPESQDASKAAPYEKSQMYDLMYNLFVNSGHQASGLRAKNINTIDEVPDSSWFTNRIGSRSITTEEITRGPLVGTPPDPSKWVLIREKTSGAHPGFTAVDAKGDTWFLEFDPKWAPGGATGSVAVATKIFWALGYNQVESFLSTFDPKNVTIDPKATVRRPNGKRTAFTHDDMNVILEHVARNPDGTYRIFAGRLLPGKILGGFTYTGTRPDDPNDLVAHEHRRELRALRVFGAWTNLTDWKDANTIDSVITENGKAVVKHYLQDVGSTFGMSNDQHEWDLGYEYFYEGPPSRKRLFTLGFGISPWQTADYEKHKEIGKFEGKAFDPRKWRPQTPTKAYMEMRDDDAFWAARRVAAFTDELIRAAVKTGEYKDPAAEKYLGDVLIQRRDKIKNVYLTAVNPVVNPVLDGKGLTFENAAVAAGVAKGDVSYRAAWMTFDNATGDTKPIGETNGTTTLAAPSGLPSSGFVAVDIAAESTAYPHWKQPVRAYFRRDGGSWKLVGLDRLPDKPEVVAGAKPGAQKATK
jgi:hypothetical protein